MLMLRGQGYNAPFIAMLIVVLNILLN